MVPITCGFGEQGHAELRPGPSDADSVISPNFDVVGLLDQRRSPGRPLPGAIRRSTRRATILRLRPRPRSPRTRSPHSSDARKAAGTVRDDVDARDVILLIGDLTRLGDARWDAPSTPTCSRNPSSSTGFTIADGHSISGPTAADPRRHPRWRASLSAQHRGLRPVRSRWSPPAQALRSAASWRRRLAGRARAAGVGEAARREPVAAVGERGGRVRVKTGRERRRASAFIPSIRRESALCSGVAWRAQAVTSSPPEAASSLRRGVGPPVKEFEMAQTHLASGPAWPAMAWLRVERWRPGSGSTTLLTSWPPPRAIRRTVPSAMGSSAQRAPWPGRTSRPSAASSRSLCAGVIVE